MQFQSLPKDFYPYTIVATDKEHDQILFKMSGHPIGLRPAVLAKTEVVEGQRLTSAGHSNGKQLTLRVGTMDFKLWKGTNKHPDKNTTVFMSLKALATSSPSVNGDSGGGVFNEQGEYIGNIMSGAGQQTTFASLCLTRKFLFPFMERINARIKAKREKPKITQPLVPIDINMGSPTDKPSDNGSTQKSLDETIAAMAKQKDDAEQKDALQEMELKNTVEEMNTERREAINAERLRVQEFIDSMAAAKGPVTTATKEESGGISSLLTWGNIGKLGAGAALTATSLAVPWWGAVALRAIGGLAGRRRRRKPEDEPAGGGSLGFLGSQPKAKGYPQGGSGQQVGGEFELERDDEEAIDYLRHARADGADSVSDAIIGRITNDRFAEAKESTIMSEEEKTFYLKQELDTLQRLNDKRHYSLPDTTIIT
jgi:hypothetical protein